MTALTAYLAFGLGFYSAAAIMHPERIKNQPRHLIAMGILGALFWPVTIYLLRKR